MPALKAFEAAARHMNFKHAAAELGLSASAVSHQVRKLEDYLQVPLFKRGYRKVELTADGAAYAADLIRGFHEIRSGTERLLNARRREPFRVSTMPVFAARYLTETIGDFERQNPELDVRWEISHTWRDFDKDDLDVAIRYGTGTWPGLHAERLFNIRGRLACAPSMLDGDPPLKRTEDLKHHVWIGVQQAPNAWHEWTEAAGVPDLQPARILWYDTLVGALQAAQTGLGFVLGPDVLFDRHIASGQLVYPFDVVSNSAESYFFVCRPQMRDDLKIKRFRSWLKKQMES